MRVTESMRNSWKAYKAMKRENPLIGYLGEQAWNIGYADGRSGRASKALSHYPIGRGRIGIEYRMAYDKGYLAGVQDLSKAGLTSWE